MTKEQEDYRNALQTMHSINKMVKAFNWKSKNLDGALDGVDTLLGVVNDQANAGVSEIDWTLNAMIDGVFYNHPNHRDVLNKLAKIETYLQAQA